MQPAVKSTWFLEKRAVVAQRLFFALGALFLLGLFFSRGLLSIVPVLMLAVALSSGNIKAKLRLLRQNRSALSLLALYGLLAVSFFYTEDRANWVTQMHRYSPLLLFSLAFVLGPPWPEKPRYALLLFFVLLTTGLAIGTVLNYLTDIEAQNQLIKYSRNPEPMNHIFHIHFGVMITLAIFFGGDLWRSKIILLHKAEKYILPASSLFLALAIHLLAYRTALLTFYVTFAVLIFRLIRRRKRYFLGGLLAAFLVLAPGVAYLSLDSWQLRVGNTRYDINRYLKHQDINYYSVSQRLAAWETALSISKRNGWLGVGPADIGLEMQRQYAVRDFGLKPENRIMIHNQYVHALVGSGLGGLLLLLYTLIYPLVRLTWQKDFGATAFLLTIGVAMLVDSFFELQRGLYLFVFFYALLIIRKEQKILLDKTD